MQKYLTYLQDTAGNALVGASVTVNVKGGGLATIYSDNGVSQKTNPIITSSDGSAWFYAANGHYDLVYAQAGFSFLAGDTTDVLLYDADDVGGGAAFTQGSVVFAGVAGVFTQDNTNFSYTSPTLTLNQLSLTTMVSDLKFTDAIYDIGKTGATRPRDIFTSRNATFGGALVVSGAGPHAIGGATNGAVQFYLQGTYTGSGGSGTTQGLAVAPTLVPAAGDSVYGCNVAATINKAGSGTHVDFVGLYLQPPTIGAGAATLTNSSTLKITDAPSVGTNKYDIWAASTTAGAHRFDGGITGSQTATFTATNKPGSGTTSPDKWLPMTIDGTLHYIPAFL